LNVQALRLFGAILLVASSLSAQALTPTAKVEARAHFESGLTHTERGELEAAIREFEAAYEKHPHFSVLYNIGQAQAALGRPVEAVATFERYLAEGAEQLSTPRREEVQALMAASRKRVGQLRIIAAAKGRTRVWLDGAELTQEQLGSPIPIATGNHTLLHSNGTGFPVSQSVSVGATEVEEVRLANPVASPGWAKLAIECDVPGVTVDVDGTFAARTPLTRPLVVLAGVHRVRFSRPGYRRVERSAAAPAEAVVSANCGLTTEPFLKADVKAWLQVSTVPKDAEVLVNGQRFLGAALPAGPHEVRVERDGFLPFRKTLSVAAGKTVRFEARLVPNAAARDRAKHAASERHSIAYLMGGVGAALLLTGGSLYLWNERRYENWQTHQPTSSLAQNLDTAASIQRVDDLSLGFLLLGAGVTASGSWLFFTPPARVE